jgi:hypothetical protein
MPKSGRAARCTFYNQLRALTAKGANLSLSPSLFVDRAETTSKSVKGSRRKPLKTTAHRYDRPDLELFSQRLTH